MGVGRKARSRENRKNETERVIQIPLTATLKRSTLRLIGTANQKEELNTVINTFPEVHSVAFHRGNSAALTRRRGNIF